MYITKLWKKTISYFYDLGMYEKMKDDDLFEYGLV